MTRKKIQIVYTGGTLGMRQTGKGYAPAKNLEALIAERLPEIGDTSMPEYELVEYETPLESSNASPSVWYDLAARLLKARGDFDGFVVIHGTDTLAYTASALSFLLGEFGKPVIVTGSQIPLVEIRSDAPGNLIGGLQAASSGRMNEVAVSFGRNLLRGNRTTKINAIELDAFGSPNFQPLAEIGTHFRYNDIAPPPSLKGVLGKPPLACADCNIAVLRIYPGMPARLIDAVADAGTCGIILRCYGVGTAPTADKEFLSALERATGKGVVVVAVSQCLEGNVSLDRYAAGSALGDIGVVSGSDMTTEAAFTKMHALFAAGHGVEDIAAHMQVNLRGELTED